MKGEVVMFGCKSKGPHKYSFETCSFGDHRWRDYNQSLYVEVDEQGSVVASGNPLWSSAPKERVHLIYLPLLRSYDLPRLVDVKLTQRVNSVEISVNLQLWAYFTIDKDDKVKFDPQDLYNNITAKDYHHLDDLIGESFLEVAKNDKFVQQAFINYAGHERPVLFIEELTQAIQRLIFSGKLLKNMEKIDVQVDFNTVTATLKASFC